MARIEQIIGEIEDYVESCKLQPLSTTKITVNKEELSGLLSDLRRNMPGEIKQYQKIISNQEAIIREARSQADGIIAEANRLTEQLVDEHEVMQRAYETANKLIDDANTQAQAILENATNEANHIKTSAIRYTDDILKNLQTIISHSMEGAQGRFEHYISTLQSSYDTVTQNRNELSGSMGEVIVENFE